MKIIPNTPLGWAWWVEQVKSLTTRPLDADMISVMMREYYIRGKTPQQYVDSLKQGKYNANSKIPSNHNGW